MIVPEASQLNYSVKNMLLNSKGKFTQCAGEIVLGTNNEHSVHATVDTSSFDSGIHSRNQHCMQPDVLNAEEYPQMVFRSTQWTRYVVSIPQWCVGELGERSKWVIYERLLKKESIILGLVMFFVFFEFFF
eukprot:GEMP01061498.1.p1 GENE.GEMP01061498.1~~GEMP01061498.1.p1  ORF type:complete len:131 (+),score=12.50 GEMP01061498.1:84-476(+)